MDPLSLVVDEVSLEGLDGITIPTLWIRLEDRNPKFPLKLDDCTKEFIWSSLVNNNELTFYELPQNRDDVELDDRFQDIDPETGIETKECFETKKDIYPVQIILENKAGIQGSCIYFKERKDVTKHIRSQSNTPLITLDGALKRYNRKLVVVASQKLRFRTLIGSESDPDLKLSDDSYCVLERVGRARWQGELQRDLHVCSFKIDARKLHYLRKSLVRHGLITIQSHVTRVRQSRQQQHSILLLLKRFHVNRRSKYDILMEQVSTFLQRTPGQFTTLVTLREHLNVDDRTFKRVYQYMRAGKLADLCRVPMEEVDPSSGPCKTKRGDKLLVRCLKMVKPYSKKGVADDDDDDDDEDDDESGARRGPFTPEGRIMERDVLSQAYDIIVASGTKGIAMRALGCKMNVGKLESRMICRKLEREGVIKGFMEDVGRQRITKFISHKCVGVSDKLQLFAKEQERNKLLCSSAPVPPNSAPASPKTPSTSKRSTKRKGKTPAAKGKQREAGGDAEKEAEEDVTVCAGEEEKPAGGGSDEDKSQGGETTDKTSDVTINQTQRESSVVEAAAAECESSALNESRTGTDSVSCTEQAPGDEDNFCSSSIIPVEQSEAVSVAADTSVVVVEDIPPPKLVSSSDKSRKSLERSHETYRLLRRKNMIVEAVHDAKVIDGLFPLQKMINEKEKEDGMSSKCCKKTILRLVQTLSREGLVKFYTTTVIQDGVSKKLEMVVHPSVQPTDDIVQRCIEQVRFKISSSYSAGCQADEKKIEQTKASDGTEPKSQKNKANKKKPSKDTKFSPTPVKGLGKSLGFQPKMHRLRVVHNFLWHMIYGHPLRNSSQSTLLNSSESNATTESSDAPQSITQSSEAAAISSVEPEAGDSAVTSLDPTSSTDEDDDAMSAGHSQSEMTVYSDEDSWKKYIPPIRVNKDYGSGWAMVGDLLLCLPLSVFIQVIQINYQVDGLEEYLNDTEKQHYLVRSLPSKMRRQLLYKRRYIFNFHENLQKLAYMGLIQFGPVEKFKDKDQVYVYVKCNATIVDTTNAEPHYWLVTESPDKPFERRQYTFNTAEDTENYWFDLMCVCLNTPLGVIRSKRSITEEEAVPSFVRDRAVFAGLAYLLKGSRDVCDDGSIPGDGKGAGGLDSEFFAHLKRNWLWTNHLLAVKTRHPGLGPKEAQMRLKSLSKTALRIVLKAGGSATPRYVTAKKMLITEETVEVAIEPASRNQQVVGGRRQKRKRTKKEVVKVPRKKKKEPKKRTPAHDEADHKALKLMTRQRVYWSVQEDSLMMLCSVASHLLNSKLKRPFVPYCVVRDLLHAEFEKSRDKTSLATGRRTRYILKNPQTLLNYRICLAEAHQDKHLMRLLDENNPADPDKPEDCSKAFLEYTKLLRQKFSSAMNSSESILPDTKQQLCSRFKICAIDSGKQVLWKDILSCTEDIHAIVLCNLIQSTLAMTNSQMKNSRSFQTFHMYSQYNQELLCQVFIHCRKRGLVNRRRVSKMFGPKKNRALPILPMSYQLSQSYFRSFSFRFPHTLCTDTFRFLRTLLNSGAGDDRPFTSFHHETENRSGIGEMLESRKTSQKKGKKESGATTEPDGTKEDDHNQSKTEGDQKITEVDVDNERTEAETRPDELKNQDDCLTSGSTREETDSPETEHPGGSLNTASPGPDESLDVSNLVQFSLDFPGGACAAALSLMTLGLVSVHMSIPKQMVVVDSTLVDNDVVKSMATLEDEDDDDDDGEECEGRKRLQVKAHQASHTNYLMMRGYCSPGIVKLRNLNTTDNIVVESCIMRLQLRNSPAHHMFTVPSSPPLDLSKCGPSLLPPVLTSSIRSSASSQTAEERDGRLIEQKGYTRQDTEVCARIRRSLDEAGDKGVDVQDFKEAHRDLEEPRSGRTRSLQRYMQDLVEEGEVLQVGAVGARWVLMQHAQPWLLTIKSNHWSQSRLTPEGLPLLDNQHRIPFMRKRNRRGAQEGTEETEETPAKKAALDENQDEKAGSENTSEKLNEEEEQKEGADEERGEEEELKRTQPEKEDKMQTETRQEKVTRLRRNSVSEEPCCGPTEQADPTE
ncbi:general transcription factor 3C polypeptide 1 isoform X2 [Sphaeramia orbicularis]|uniref:general transcription factor 3C polypeptide 1 isoform X2 n=1 Tax=Sphaeramia orbicularis TaxID=375764 RepID=UPI00118131DA|nr:general transcription factor 3C polypeptide 1 isoform X2 [Sphaeramia orbicularis]